MSDDPTKDPTSEPVAETSPETPPVEATAQEPGPTAQIPVDEPLSVSAEPLPEPPANAPQPPPTPSPSPVPSPAPAVSNAEENRSKLVQARAVKQDRKRKKLNRILEELTTKGSITNDDVEKLLHVSDATATRYLAQLEKEGKVVQVGKTGHEVKYQKL